LESGRSPAPVLNTGQAPLKNEIIPELVSGLLDSDKVIKFEKILKGDFWNKKRKI
jgi:hypothetical protein